MKDSEIENLERFWANYNRNQEQYLSQMVSFDVEEILAMLSENLQLTGLVLSEGRTVRVTGKKTTDYRRELLKGICRF